MKGVKAIVTLHVALGLLTLCAGLAPEGVESSTSTSVSVSTVTRKVTSRSFPRTRRPGNDTQTATEDATKVHDAGRLAGEEADAVAKPLKVKKKILASNLKNANEKLAFPGEKHEKVVAKTAANVTETADGGKPNSSDSSEDEMVEETGKTENVTSSRRNGSASEGPKRIGGAIEGRSLEDRSSEENINVNANAKTKIPAGTTARTTNGYYEAFGKLEKVLNTNYLNNNDGYEGGNVRPSQPVALPAKKPTPISRENSLKNAIRFESEYYGPTGQTDWVPIIPEKLPERSPPGGGQHFGSKLTPPLVEKSNKTIVFPSDDVRPVPETERTTQNVRAVSKSPGESANATQPTKPALKFRGAVRYKPLQSNSTDDKKVKNETAPKKNISLEVPAMEIPVTGASWTLATLGGSGRPTSKPAGEETTEISVVSSTNHTTKSQNAVDGGLAVPPENVKVDNVTKEPNAKNVASGSPPDDAKHNKTDIANSLPEVIDGGQGWIPIKIEKEPETKNDTEVVVPGVPNQRNESATEAAKTSTAETETTSEDVTGEEVTTTESVTELTTVPKLFTPTTETSVAPSQRDEIETEETVTATSPKAAVTSTPEITLPTTLKLRTETELDTSTEPPTTSPIQSPTPVSETVETPVTTTPTPVATSVAHTSPNTTTIITTTTTTTTTTITTSTATSAKVVENVTSTTVPVETTNPKPQVTQTTTPTAPTTTTPRATTAKPQTEETRSETTEESIYYRNYVPTTINPYIDITEENVPAYLRLTVQARGWEELCRLKEDLRDAIMKMLGGKNVSAESVHFLNLNDRNCLEKIEESKGEPHNGTIFLPVNMFLMDRNGDFDKNLSEAFLTLWGRRGLDFELPIRKVDFVTPIVNLTELADPPLGGSVVAAIVISCVAGICVILLGVLFVIMKRRQKRFNYGQRCTPVSLDAYSLDSVSIYNSVRRKGVRASKRSYGNAAFDDPEVPTHAMNFAGLANFSSDKEQLHEEFGIIPQVYPKVEELPPGAERKNRYANIIPLPETRVHLTPKDGDALSDYINANYVRGLKGAEKLYIACQAPMESTVEDFWRMVWEQQCKVILMITDLQENGIEKCADYLPPNEVTDNLRLFGDFQVTLKKRDVKEKYIISNLKLKNMEANLWREVTHLWYLGWPDQGVPSEANSLIAFLIEARSQMKIQNGATTSSPIVVHCSPGTGRTGTVIACDLCIREYEQSRMVDIPRCVFNLRRDRAGAVQTKDQYAFIYQVLNVYATKLSGGGIESI